VSEFVDRGSRFDGVLRKSLEAHCRSCGEAALGLPDDHDAAKRELRSDLGWGTRGGLWICKRCLSGFPVASNGLPPLSKAPSHEHR